MTKKGSGCCKGWAKSARTCTAIAFWVWWCCTVSWLVVLSVWAFKYDRDDAWSYVVQLQSNVAGLQNQINAIDTLDTTYTNTMRKDDAWLTCMQIYNQFEGNISSAIGYYSSNQTAYNITVARVLALVVSGFNYTIGGTTYSGYTGLTNYIGGFANNTANDNRIINPSNLDLYTDSGSIRTLVLGGPFLDIYSASNITYTSIGRTQARCVEQTAGVFLLNDAALTISLTAREQSF